jgi:acylpyruvate hydrolase
MRLATIRTAEGTRAARLDGGRLLFLRSADVGELLAGADPEAALGETTGGEVAVEEADFAPLIPRPSKIFCVGLNYRGHIRETGAATPTYPTLFAKFAASLTGARDDIELASISDRIDWEVELGVVIGRPIRRATPDEALEAIAGYTVVNDVSMRDWQFRTPQWLQGKAFEASTPVGPYLVTPDEIDHARDLEVRCEVDSEVMQLGRTTDLLFTPAEIASYISQFITLEPGDLISTGTPSGVGDARKPPVYLKPGQVMLTRVEGVGECVNLCREEKL